MRPTTRDDVERQVATCFRFILNWRNVLAVLLGVSFWLFVSVLYLEVLGTVATAFVYWAQMGCVVLVGCVLCYGVYWAYTNHQELGDLRQHKEQSIQARTLLATKHLDMARMAGQSEVLWSLQTKQYQHYHQPRSGFQQPATMMNNNDKDRNNYLNNN